MLTAAEVKEEIAGQKITTVKEVVELIVQGTRGLLRKEVGEHDANTRIAQFYDMICTVTAAKEVESTVDAERKEEEDEQPKRKAISKQRLQTAQQSDVYCTAMRKHLQSGGEWLPKEERLARRITATAPMMHESEGLLGLMWQRGKFAEGKREGIYLLQFIGQVFRGILQ